MSVMMTNYWLCIFAIHSCIQWYHP